MKLQSHELSLFSLLSLSSDVSELWLAADVVTWLLWLALESKVKKFLL